MSSIIGLAQTVSLAQERQYVFPQYTEIAPCPCDLSPGCDTYCCCDPTCPVDPPFPCIPGLPGGQPGGKLQDYNCSEPAPVGISTLQLDNYLHPLLCIHSSNSPYLGHYHKPAPKLESQVQHEEVRRRSQQQKGNVKKSTFEAKGYGASVADSGNATLPYKRGITVKTVFSVGEDITGVLSLPSPSLTSSHCSSHPIRFLVPTSHRCLSELSPQVVVLKNYHNYHVIVVNIRFKQDVVAWEHVKMTHILIIAVIIISINIQNEGVPRREEQLVGSPDVPDELPRD